MLPKISVIIPVYNAAAGLERCLRSVKAQSYKNIEVLIIDDGSTDESGLICDHLSAEDSRFLVYHISNGGVSYARNYALDRMTGNYCAFIDADDIVLPDYLEKLYFALQKYRTKISVCTWEYLAPNTSDTWECKDSDVVCVEVDESYSHMGKYAHYMVWGGLYDKSIVSQVRFDTDLYVAEDSLFYARLLKQCQRFAYLDMPLYGYVINSSSACHGDFDEKKYTEIIAWRRIYNLFSDKKSKLYSSCRAACAFRVYKAIRSLQDQGREMIHIQNELIKEARNNFWYFMHSDEVKVGLKFRYIMLVLFPKAYFAIYHVKRRYL